MFHNCSQFELEQLLKQLWALNLRTLGGSCELKSELKSDLKSFLAGRQEEMTGRDKKARK